uniref:Non-specific serine/threonine protein kinase (EC) n=1 Tax=Ganoderma boninense TaxID=34458 RepID=A0A5K1K683_9APHY|nr:Non-specific serine/threonine protein kinase (EC [Ganoderma boninense]
MSYFDQLKWEDDWKNIALTLVKEEWQTKYVNRSSEHEPACETNLRASTPPRTPTQAGDSEDGDVEFVEDMEEIEEDDVIVDDNDDGDNSTIHSDEFGPDLFDVFDNTAPPALAELGDELGRYLRFPIEHAPNAIKWWVDWRVIYPNLSRMALDYLTIPATSVDVERVFSRGRLLLSHICNRLSAQSTRAILCLGSWAQAGFVKPADERKVTQLEEIDNGDEEASDYEMEEGWDAIDTTKL